MVVLGKMFENSFHFSSRERLFYALYIYSAHLNTHKQLPAVSLGATSLVVLDEFETIIFIRSIFR